MRKWGVGHQIRSNKKGGFLKILVNVEGMAKEILTDHYINIVELEVIFTRKDKISLATGLELWQ